MNSTDLTNTAGGRPRWLWRIVRWVQRAWLFEQACSAEERSEAAYAKGNWSYGFEQKCKADQLYERWHMLRRKHGVSST